VLLLPADPVLLLLVDPLLPAPWLGGIGEGAKASLVGAGHGGKQTEEEDNRDWGFLFAFRSLVILDMDNVSYKHI